MLAAKRIGVRPEEAVYMGDAENDMKAAKAAGAKIIIYGKESFDGADAYASSFRELPELIALL